MSSQILAYQPQLLSRQAANVRVFTQNQKTGNKQIIKNLKSEMSSIREGMTKLMRVKSHQHIKTINLNKSVVLNGQDCCITAPTLDQCQKHIEQNFEIENLSLKRRVSFLEKQNLNLLQKIKETENLLNMQRKIYSEKIIQLELININSHQLIQKLQMENIRLKSIKKQQKRRSASKKQHCNELKIINPQQQIEFLQKSQILLSRERPEKQMGSLKKKINKLQNQLQTKQNIILSYEKIIEQLNQKIVQMHFLSLSARKAQKLKDYD